MKQPSLFPDDIKTLKNEISLVISKTKNKVLTKEQSAFNEFSKKIETLRKQIETDQLKYDKLLNHFSAAVTPAQEAYCNVLIEFVKALYAIYKHEKLTGINKEKLQSLILKNLDDAFQYVVPADDVKVIYDALNPVSYAEEEAEEFAYRKVKIEEMLREEYGMDVNFSDVEMNDEALARKLAEMKDEFEKGKTGSHSGRKKTKKEVESEIKYKQAEDLQNKNIRSIYMSLVKMLHPDLEKNNTLKIQKEELMKKVNKAYHEKDLHSLLKLEVEIIHNQSENLDHLTDEKLLFLNAALKEQAAELQDELQILRYNPRYQQIADYMYNSESTSLRIMRSVITELQSTQKEIVNDTEQLNGPNKINFIKFILRQISYDRDFPFNHMHEFGLNEFIDITAATKKNAPGRTNKTPKKKKRK